MVLCDNLRGLCDLFLTGMVLQSKQRLLATATTPEREDAMHSKNQNAPVWGANPNHHLFNNNGTWFIHYTVYPTALTKQRIRRSLKTKSLKEAQERRDEFFARQEGEVAISCRALAA